MYSQGMARRQERAVRVARAEDGSGRVAQRRRTRAAIVEAATRLLAEGRTPSVDEVAEAADVSRRTVYMYFPTLDQLLLDAAVGALSATQMDEAMTAAPTAEDPAARVEALVATSTRLAPTTLPLGRKIVRLTVDPSDAAAPASPRRGYRRVEWIERALEPLRGTLSDEQFERLASALCLLVGWEAQIVLRDVRGLDAEAEERVLSWAARALVAGMLAEAEPG
jgi:AcrR family transcriptional regulator